ncbi:MAG: transporter substrate-binding domain-containing protein [Clostridia bacterium]|nr:transporter substrate-binding domain-containing protein [Clostridia bacterium]
MKKILASVLALFMVVSLFLLTSCNNSNTGKKTLKVAMECAYAPYNWAQSDNSNGSVPISGRSDFANGYDVMIAKKICEKNGWDLEIYSLDWDALIPAVQTGQVDCVIAGQSMTEDRKQQVDFAGPYLYATIVCLVKSDSAYASATSINDFAGAKCTSQLGTIWYDTCLPQVKDATVLAGKESAPAMLMALETGEVDFVCTDRPTAQAAVIAYPDLKILDFAGTEGDFQVDEGEINIGISVQKGNTELFNKINDALKGMTADDFNAIMNDAIKIQPVSN